jgi:hypothetical protein
MLSIIGAGLSRTGTTSLHLALELLGFRSIHFEGDRLNDVLDGANANPDFRRFEDVDAVVDLPYSYFYRELHEAYPDSKVILTVRDAEDWWKSVSTLFNVVAPVPEHPTIRQRIAQRLGLDSEQQRFDAHRRRIRNCVYGSSVATEFLYKTKYARHNAEVVATISADRLLVMNIPAGDGWEKLCPFLGVAIPDAPFPRSNTINYEDPAPWARAHV